MLGKNLSNICNSVICFFSKTVGKVDKVVKFAKRKSKLGAQLFAEALIAGCLSDPTISLERLCKLMKQKGVKISKQGLHQRFNCEATILMQKLFTESLQQFKTDNLNIIDLLKPFASVKMIDSSGISLPSNLKDIYKGTGGKASEAGLKIQVLFDYVQGQINEATITAGCKSDQGFNDHLNKIEKGALYLQDLGYFKFKSFEAIKNKNAYFISRHLHRVIIQDEHNNPLNLMKELRSSGSFFTKQVKLGEKEKIDVRLIAFRLPDIEVEDRIRKIKRKHQNKGRTPSKETLEFAQWSIYITNVPQNILNDTQIYLVYSLRWQIGVSS
jgi:hypothetical protein